MTACLEGSVLEICTTNGANREMLSIVSHIYYLGLEAGADVP